MFSEVISIIMIYKIKLNKRKYHFPNLENKLDRLHNSIEKSSEKKEMIFEHLYSVILQLITDVNFYLRNGNFHSLIFDIN